ncbi:MAG TPA: 23S rRNA (adenine(2030)-N(6))-methyltransferase RlmJ, partial [Gammaproteobacteria bacterium]|nr:23S rRNA (adenine(2030)-N(6))-methyltransferase RlmJ [Gammaproteobacteria bacterium]
LHGYHAGNHADVLKHTVLTAVLARLVAKDKPLRYVDTHAGAGGYDLRAATAQRNREHEGGVGKLWVAADAPPAVARWLALAHRYNGDGALRRYPGSPWFAAQALRASDDLFLFELHPAEHRALKKNLDGDRRIKLLRADGLAACIGLVPPPAKRALVLIDPSYELRDEHRAVIDSVVKLHKRFATGTIAIWYPVIERRWVERYERALRAAGIGAFATYELCVAHERRGGGLTGSGLFVLNPPWQLDDELETALPWLVQRLGVDDGAGFRLLSA